MFLFFVVCFLFCFCLFYRGEGGRKNIKLGGKGVGEDLGEIEGEENLIRNIFFNKNVLECLKTTGLLEVGPYFIS